MHVIGADVTKRGWAAVRWDGAVASLAFYPSFDALWRAGADAAVIGVDIPIGLTDGPGREADVLARRELGPRASSVFPTPCRPALAEADYVRACDIHFELVGKRISKQAHSLRRRIFEVDAHVGDTRLFEVHPEVSFAAMNGAPLPFSKKTWGGMKHRLELLQAEGLVPAGLDAVTGKLPVDDVLDAAAVAWTALRIARGVARSIPPEPRQHDRSGHPLAIWV